MELTDEIPEKPMDGYINRGFLEIHMFFPFSWMAPLTPLEFSLNTQYLGIKTFNSSLGVSSALLQQEKRVTPIKRFL